MQNQAEVITTTANYILIMTVLVVTDQKEMSKVMVNVHLACWLNIINGVM